MTQRNEPTEFRAPTGYPQEEGRHHFQFDGSDEIITVEVKRKSAESGLCFYAPGYRGSFAVHLTKPDQWFGKARIIKKSSTIDA